MTNFKPNQALFGKKYLSKFVSFITKVNPNNENDTKQDVFPWKIFKYIIFH